ncbi:MAG: lipocalin family protein [Silicimonas sp.]|nr:lipocalin family protein [Silicimonas sp.]NND17589.1 lipocalin family protein [Silicimonas sp.]NNL36586.1 lipocalin family protein [Silicimonas sp.]
MRRLGVYGLVLLLAACAANTGYRDRDVEMTSMAVFDPSRYLGTWYEIARFPVSFQKGCSDVRAIYGDDGAGGLTVRNTCLRNGEMTTIDGTADIVGPGRLKVRLGGVPFAADYWVLWVDEGYRTAVVGVPSGRAGWILNRDPEIPADRLDAARSVLDFNGYDLGRLQRTAHGGSE